MFLTNVYKRCLGFFVFCLDLELYAKTENDLVSTDSQKPVLLITQDRNKIKNAEHPFVDIGE